MPKSVPFEEPRVQTSFLVDPDGGRPADEPSDEAARLFWIFSALVRRREVSYGSYCSIFQRGDRTFKRDVAKLRKLGEQNGFVISRQRSGRISLLSVDARFDAIESGTRDVLGLVREMAEALGGPLRGLVEPVTRGVSSANHFLQIAAPRLVEETEVAAVFHELRDAAQRDARVEFRYVGRTGSETVRTVEPYLVILHGGRYYLVAYDAAPRKGWRLFALDRICRPIRRLGTFSRRAVPETYLSQDVVGLFKSGALVAVSIELSPAVAASVTARVWQKAQRVEYRQNGGAIITLFVSDVFEAVRWALGFGVDALVLAPPSAVRAARETLQILDGRYGANGASDMHRAAG